MLNKPSLAVSCLVLLATSGCVVVDGGPAPVYYGDLDTFVTINGTTDPGECAYYQIDYVNIDVYDSRGNPVASAQPICEDFGVGFANLAEDTYSVDVQLIGYAGEDASDIVRVQVDVFRDDLTILELDFPDGAIY